MGGVSIRQERGGGGENTTLVGLSTCPGGFAVNGLVRSVTAWWKAPPRPWRWYDTLAVVVIICSWALCFASH